MSPLGLWSAPTIPWGRLARVTQTTDRRLPCLITLSCRSVNKLHFGLAGWLILRAVVPFVAATVAGHSPPVKCVSYLSIFTFPPSADPLTVSSPLMFTHQMTHAKRPFSSQMVNVVLPCRPCMVVKHGNFSQGQKQCVWVCVSVCWLGFEILWKIHCFVPFGKILRLANCLESRLVYFLSSDYINTYEVKCKCIRQKKSVGIIKHNRNWLNCFCRFRLLQSHLISMTI